MTSTPLSHKFSGLSTLFRIVLVRPRNPLNIGAVARAMANFGLRDLVVVKPYPPIWRETVSAPGAEKLVKSAKRVFSLDAALGDCDWVVGTTAVRRRRLERPLISLPKFTAHLLKKRKSVRRAALVFGPEKTGLTNAALRRCHALLTIPTREDCPSMNLGQAVATCCYELIRGEVRLPVRNRDDDGGVMAQDQIERIVSHALEAFSAVGYLKFLSARVRADKIRRSLLRWKLAGRDGRLLHGFLRYVVKNVGRT